MKTYTKITRLIVLVVSLFNLLSCASIQGYTNCDVHSSSQLPSLHPAEYGVILLSTQHIVIRANKNKFEFISLLEIHPDKLSLASLTPLGQKLFQLQYTRQKLDYHGQGVPASFDPAFLLTDISLIYGKEPSLRQCFKQAQIPFLLTKDKKNTRSMRINGIDEITIQYSGEAVWGSHITYTNHTRDYTIEIKSLGVERL